MSGLYSFRNLAPADLPMLRTWLATPEALRWWGDPSTEAALIEVDLTNEAMRQWIVSHDDRPFGYAQAYEVHAWPQPHLAELPQGAMAVDAFIGVPHMIGQGHGGPEHPVPAEGRPGISSGVVPFCHGLTSLRRKRNLRHKFTA